MIILILLLLGLFAGTVAGLLGVGGGILFTPILFFLFRTLSPETVVPYTIATSLLCTFAASLSSSWKHYRKDNFWFKESAKIGLLALLGISLGKQVTLAEFYSQHIFGVLFSFLLLYTAFNFFTTKSPKIDLNQPEKTMHWRDYLLVGSLGGFVAALAGVGGGIVMVPLLSMVYKRSFYKTVSISSFAIVIISFLAVLQMALEPASGGGLSEFTVGYVDLGAAFPLIVGSIIGAQVGAHLSGMINTIYLKRGFGFLAVSVAIKLLYDAIGSF